MAFVDGLTIDEFERLPDALALNHELVDGKLVDVSGNTPRHNSLRDLLIQLLSPVAEEAALGMVIAEQDFEFAGNVHGPDVSFIAEPKRRWIEWDKRVQRFVPDLAIEIVSSCDTFENVLSKAIRYRECGTSEVWLLSIGLRQALRFSASGQAILGEKDAFAPEAIPGFSIPIGELLDRVAQAFMPASGAA